MIIGNGNIAKVLEDKKNLTFFASGVSDSLCTDINEFSREWKMLYDIPRNKHIVYFSSLGIYRWKNKYIDHKINMENLVRQFDYYTIIRVEVIDWGRNKNTIHNYFRRMLNENTPICIQNTYRYITTIEEFRYWVGLIKPYTKGEMNITGTKYHVVDIYKMVLEKKL